MVSLSFHTDVFQHFLVMAGMEPSVMEKQMMKRGGANRRAKLLAQINAEFRGKNH